MIRKAIVPICICLGLLSCGSKGEATNSSSTNDTVQTSNSSAPERINLDTLKPVAGENIFPVVSFGSNKAAAAKVNTYLQLEQLQHLPGVFKKNPFELVMGNEEHLSPTSQFYEWSRNKTISNILSLTLEGESTGAYSEGFSAHYNFDTRTGDKISVKSIFTKTGLETLGHILNKKVKKQIDDYLVDLKRPLDKPSDEEIETRNDQIAIYEDCLEYTLNYKTEDYSFYFVQDSIVFERGRCSNHAMRALDDLDRFSIPMSFATLQQYLTPYGSSLLANLNDNTVPQSPEDRLYKGFIDGKYPIRALITNINDDGSFTMQYWYEKNNIPIEWSGSFNGKHFSLKETETVNEEYRETAKIEADWIDNKSIEGTWQNLKTGATLSLKLEAY